MKYILVLILLDQGSKQEIPGFDTLAQCRQHAHELVQAAQGFNPDQHLFTSPKGTAMAYCKPSP